MGPRVIEFEQEQRRRFRRFARALGRALMGPKAPPRIRRRRLAKKVAKRGGYMRHGSAGAILASVTHMITEAEEEAR